MGIDNMEDRSLEGLGVVGTSQIIQNKLNSQDSDQYLENKRKMIYDSLAGHIRHQFQINKDARRDSGIEDEIFSSLRAYNGQYSPEDLQAIGSGSRIFMNLTATKCRAACSWIRDILMSPKYKPWMLSPTPSPDLPEKITSAIESALKQEFGDMVEAKKASPQEMPQGPSNAPVGSTQVAPGNKTSAKEAQRTIREINQNRRDITDAIAEDIFNQAKYDMSKIEVQIEDDLAEGGWEDALSAFIEDFTVFPNSFMKAPVITKTTKLTWKNGVAEPVEGYTYLNKRVSPIDMYPSPNATCIQDGNLIEHIRLSRKEVYDLKDLPKYKNESIDKVLELTGNGMISTMMLDTGIEGDKANEEKRGDEFDANLNVLHGLHYFGSAPASKLREWGVSEEDLEGAEDTKEIEIEAILVENEVIKCCINKDPLLRRPYYKASWQNIPGSFWGRSLPSLMDSDQRMCNATARALANNMGIASGPQVEVYVDRLADNGAIDDITPFKIWQMTSDPTGAGGRSITWHQPTSNANELLAVYKEFEQKADDSTGIPRYAYGNEKSGGAAQTASGLSMLLESASKSIKDAIRHIDVGLIKPRIEYQFYWHMLENETPYTGDLEVIVMGSSALTVHGAEQLRRNEFLQITANQTDAQIIGMEGRAVILREIAKDLNLPENVVPSRLEIKEKEEEMKQAAQAQAQAEAKKEESGLAATKMQIDGQKEMHMGTLQSKQVDQQLQKERQDGDLQVKIADIRANLDKANASDSVKAQIAKMAADQKDLANKREISFKLQTGMDGI